MKGIIEEDYEFSANLNLNGQKNFRVRPAGEYVDPETGKLKQRKFNIFISDAKNFISLTPVEVLVLARALQDEKLKEQMTLRAEKYLEDVKKIIV